LTDLSSENKLLIISINSSFDFEFNSIQSTDKSNKVSLKISNSSDIKPNTANFSIIGYSMIYDKDKKEHLISLFFRKNGQIESITSFVDGKFIKYLVENEESIRYLPDLQSIN
jgi:antitoxin component YwqK of YwqJK toxin-antitoxin module